MSSRTRWMAAALVLAALWKPTDAAAQESPASALSLLEAVGEALRNNDRLLTQSDSAERAQLAVTAARSSFRPKVVPNIRGSFGQTDVSDQSYRVDVSQRLVTGTEFRAGIGTSTAQIPSLSLGQDIRFYNTDTTLMVTQPLLRGFGRNATRRGLTTAERRRDESLLQQRLTEQQVTLDVADSYYRVVAQQALVVAASRGLERARQLRASSEAKLSAGLVSQLDALRAQQLVAQAQLQLFDAEAAAEDSLDALRYLIGRPQGEPLAVVSAIPNEVDQTPADEAVRLALATRSDLILAQRQTGDTDAAIAFARNQLLPQVDLNLALTRRRTGDSLVRSFGLDGYQFAAFFNIAMPVDRTPQLVEFQNALIDRDQRRRDLDSLERRIGDDIRRLIRDRERVQRNLAAAEANVSLAQQEVNVARLRYDRGLSNNLDVVTAESNLLGAESSVMLAAVDLAMNRLRLRAAMGVLDPLRDTASTTIAP